MMHIVWILVFNLVVFVGPPLFLAVWVGSWFRQDHSRLHWDD